jgi:agmatinase
MNDEILFAPPVATLFDCVRGEASDLEQGQVGVVGMPTDWTHSSRIGTRFGPRALRHASTQIVHNLRSKSKAGLVDPVTGQGWALRKDALVDCGDARVNGAVVEETTQNIAAMTRAITARSAVPLALGGDHYNSFPACLGYSQGLAERDPNARFGYIQFDGHLDFSDKLGAWGTHNHATNARRVAELPNVIVANMVWIGVTGWVDGGDLELIDKLGGKVFSSGDVHRLGATQVAQQALAHALRGCDQLYLSIDVDAMDAGYLPGTGSIVHSGITPRQYCQMLDVLANAPIAGLDLVEVAPLLDPSGRTEQICAHMLYRVLQRFILAKIKPLEG